MKASTQILELVKQVVWKWSGEVPRAKNLFSEKGGFSINNDIDLVCDILLKELLATGLDENSEPTDRGRQLEAAIDWVRSARRLE